VDVRVPPDLVPRSTQAGRHRSRCSPRPFHAPAIVRPDESCHPSCDPRPLRHRRPRIRLAGERQKRCPSVEEPFVVGSSVPEYIARPLEPVALSEHAHGLVVPFCCEGASSANRTPGRPIGRNVRPGSLGAGATIGLRIIARYRWSSTSRAAPPGHPFFGAIPSGPVGETQLAGSAPVAM